MGLEVRLLPRTGPRADGVYFERLLRACHIPLRSGRLGDLWAWGLKESSLDVVV